MSLLLARLVLEPAALAAPPPSESGVPNTDYPAIGTLYVFEDGAGGAQVCTATLLSPSVFLTAAHCADKVESWWSGGFDVYFLTGPDVAGWEYGERVDSVLAHPDWDEETLEADIGVGVLRRPMDAPPPLDIGAPTWTEADLGESLWLIGWGGTASDGSGAGTSRLAEGTLHSLDDRDYVYEEASDGQSACPGDSGAPILRPHEDGTVDLVGVVSWGNARTDGHCGPYTGGPRLDAYQDWVLAQVAAAEDSGEGEPEDSGEGTADTSETADTGETGETGAELDAGGKAGGEEARGGCACATGAEQPGLALALFGLLGGIRRRTARSARRLN